MFRRSLQVLVVSSIVALALIVGYATIQFRGAPEMFAEAEAKFAAGKFAQTIDLLTTCESSVAVQKDREMRRRLWRLRMKANIELDNPRGALLDVDHLLSDGLADDASLQLDRIRLLAQGEQGQRALDLARTFVATHPDDPAALEAAAQASRAASDERLEPLLAGVRRDVGAMLRDRARDLVMIYLHRPDGDAELTLAIDELQAMYAADTRLSTNWEPLLRDLRQLRGLIQEGLGFCRNSVALGGEPTVAQRELTRGLDLAGRTDDLLMQAEIFRRRFDNKDVLGSGRDAVVALFRRGADAATIATAARWLPAATLEARAKKKLLGDAVQDLLLARLVAAWRLADRPAIQRFFQEFLVMQRGGYEPLIPTRLQFGLLHAIQQEWKFAEPNLRNLTDLLVRESADDRPFDLLGTVVPIRVDVLRELKAPEDGVLTLLNAWVKARGDQLRPRLTLARYLIEQNRVPAALDLIEEAPANFAYDPELFLLRVTARALRDDQAGNGGEALYAQCLKRASAIPEVPDPIGYLLCANAATAHGSFDIVRECARMAVDAFPLARLPRIYEIHASLATNRVQNAVELARRMVATVPLDDIAAWMVVDANRRANLPLEEALFHALPLCKPSLQLGKEALRSAVEHTPTDAVAYALRMVNDPAADAGHRLGAARAFAIADRTGDAERMLDSVPADAALTATETNDRVFAIAAWVKAAARERDDATLQRDADRRLASVDARSTATAGALVAAAEAIAATHPRTAYDLVVRTLGTADPEARCGKTLALAGDLAARLGLADRAEEHRLAAVAFSDGRAAATELARAWIAAGRADRARAALSIVEKPTDPALTLWAGDRSKARELATAAIALDGTDLIANAVLALLGTDGLADWRHVPETQIESRSELLAILSGASCGSEVVARARALVAEDPSPTSKLLLARALRLSGAHDAAATLHTELLATKSPLLWRELAIAAGTEGYTLPKPCETALLEGVSANQFLSSTSTMVFALRRLVELVEKAAGPTVAQQSREVMWQTYPRDGFRPAEDLPHLANVANPRLAWTVLDAAANDPAITAPELHARIRDALFVRAEQIASVPGDITDVYGAALRRLAADGAHGCIVHFLLDHAERVPSLRIDDATARALLRAQIAKTAEGSDDESWLHRSLRRIARDSGPAAAAADLDAVLREHPTSLVLWRVRATLPGPQERDDLALVQLRAVLAHVEAPAEQLAMLSLAAAKNLPSATALPQFHALPREVRNSPAGVLAAGLLRLREGSPDEAIPFLQQAPAQPDGLHLYALALAHLQSRDGNGGDLARECLLALVRDYPSSSLARNAGNFAAQLAPR